MVRAAQPPVHQSELIRIIFDNTKRIDALVKALEECARDDFAGSKGISPYAAASNELVRRTLIAREALRALVGGSR